mgnify:CR=1 FL=1
MSLYHIPLKWIISSCLLKLPPPKHHWSLLTICSFKIASEYSTLCLFSGVMQATNENLPPRVIKELARELKSLDESPPDDIRVLVNDDNFSMIFADIEGPCKLYHVLPLNSWIHNFLFLLSNFMHSFVNVAMGHIYWALLSLSSYKICEVKLHIFWLMDFAAINCARFISALISLSSFQRYEVNCHKFISGISVS